MWISLSKGAEIAGSPTGEALRKFIVRWNTGHPYEVIRRRWGKVHYRDLLLALDQDSRDYTPGQGVADSISKSL